MGCVSLSARLFRRRRDHRKAHEACAHRRAARTRAGHQPLQAFRVGHRVSAPRARCAPWATRCRRASRRRRTSTATGLEWLLQECLRAGQTSRLKLPGLSPERQEVLPGGLAILRRGVRPCSASRRCASPTARCAKDCCTTCSAASPTRTRACAACARWKARFHVDTAQADRVEATALAFLRQVRDDWGLRRSARRAGARLGGAPARGRARHRAFAVPPARRLPAAACATCPAFRSHEQQLLAAIVGGHRRKLTLAALDDLMPPWHLKALYLIVLLRLAVLLHRGRGPRSLPDIRLAAKGKSAGADVSARLARRASAHRRRPRAGSRLPARPPASGCESG